MLRFLVLTLTLTLFVGCSTRGSTKSPHTYSKKKSSNKTTKTYHTKSKPVTKSSGTKNYADLDKLYPYHNKWHQTPYKFGGYGSNGIDCSAFVQRTYYDLFHMKIPRTTKEQVKAGWKVPRSQIRTSDLIFFKTGYNSRHVGVYLQNGDFMHASSSHGIIISNINDPYWKKRYWMVRRYR